MKTLIYNCSALLMDEANTLLNNAFIAVEDIYITYVGVERPQGEFTQEIDAKGNVVMPGLVNAHTHIPMTLMRGYGGGCNLQTWLNDFIFPVEDKLDERSVRVGVQLALAELIASGVTTIADMYMFCDAICDEIVKAGISGNICRGMVLFAPEFDTNTNAGYLEMQELMRDWHGKNDGQILIDACVHGEYTSNPALWEAMAGFAKEHQIGMHVHVSETKMEHENCIEKYGKTPLQTLHDYGLWDTRSILAHCVWTTEDDWALMKEKNITAVHNPVSNLKLGSGIARIPQMMNAGVQIALGTDGVASNNSHDMFEEMKFASLLQKGVSCNPTMLTAYDTLKMATSNGAKALGRKTGQLKEGYIADIIMLNRSAFNLTPCHSVEENLVYSANGSNVCMNMSRGKVIYKDGEFFTLDISKLQSELKQYALPLLFGSK